MYTSSRVLSLPKCRCSQTRRLENRFFRFVLNIHLQNS